MNASKLGRVVISILVLVSLFYRVQRVLTRSESDWQQQEIQRETRHQQLTDPIYNETAKLRAELDAATAELKTAEDYCTAYKALSPKEQKSSKSEALQFAKELTDPTAQQTVKDCVDPHHKTQ